MFAPTAPAYTTHSVIFYRATWFTLQTATIQHGVSTRHTFPVCVGETSVGKPPNKQWLCVTFQQVMAKSPGAVCVCVNFGKLNIFTFNDAQT
jgi:hypothetical protein